MRALITGGAGFIGSHLAEALISNGYHVTVIDDLSTGSFDNICHLAGQHDFQFALDTITNEMVLDRLVSECDVIFHLAAVVGVKLIVRDPVGVIETNVMGTETVLRIAERYRKKVMLASTSEVYGKSNRIPFSENGDRLLGPTTVSRWSYSASKAIDEFLALAYQKETGLPVVIFRLFNTIGPRQTGQYGMVVPRFAQQALAGEPLTVYGDGEQSRCFCDVREVVKAIAHLSECPDAIGEIFNIGNDKEITILELAQLVRRLAGSRSEIVFIPYEEAYEKGFEDMRRRVPSIAKIRSIIGWEPRLSIEETLKDIIAGLSARREVSPVLHSLNVS